MSIVSKVVMTLDSEFWILLVYVWISNNIGLTELLKLLFSVWRSLINGVKVVDIWELPVCKLLYNCPDSELEIVGLPKTWSNKEDITAGAPKAGVGLL